MLMSIRPLYNPNVATIAPEAGIVEAARAMRTAHVGDLVVIELRRGYPVPIGIVTDRDIVVGVVAREAAPAEIAVADLMSRNLVLLDEDSGIDAALRAMREAGVRRAPVVGPDGQLVGILSIDDIIDRMARQLTDVATLIATEQDHEGRLRP
jgi:CBS domain-containing protein